MSERKQLTIEQATKCLHNGKYIHIYRNAPFGLVGADWHRKEVIKEFENADKIEIGGEQCRAIGHGIVVIPKGAKKQSDLLFVECNNEKLEEYDK